MSVNRVLLIFIQDSRSDTQRFSKAITLFKLFELNAYYLKLRSAEKLKSRGYYTHIKFLI